MKLSCTQENLSAGLSIVGPVSSKAGSLPILGNILLSAKEGALTLSATNLEIGITANVRGKIEEEGVFTVHGRLFCDYVNLLSGDNVGISLSGDHLLVKSGNQQTKIHGLSAEEFPVIPKIEGSPKIIVDSKDVRESLGRVLFAVSNSDARPELGGVLLRFSENSLLMVATDSYRLAESSVLLKTKIPEPRDVIVPFRTMQELSRVLGNVSGELSIIIGDSQILFSFEEAELVSRIIIGNFPNYKQIIPTNKKSVVTLDKEPFARAIKSASLFCKQGLNHVSLQFSSGKILVSASSSQAGENMIEVPADIEGSDIDIVFDYRFVLEGLSAIPGSEVVVSLESGSSPCVFTPKEKGYLYLVMPIKQ
jgi:DNA polymerase III subunit beta